MSNDGERICKEAVVTQFEVISRNLHGETEENRKSVRVAGLRDDIWTCDFPDTKQEYQSLGRDVRSLKNKQKN